MFKKTKIFKINKKNFEEVIKASAMIIKRGGTVAFPTETVYGLGADFSNKEAITKIFNAKNRPLDNPLIVHIESLKSLSLIAMEIPEDALKIANIFWPGPLTIILKKNNKTIDLSASKLKSIAIRMPKNKIALALIKEAGTPIAAPSANLSGRPSPTEAKHVFFDLDGKIDAIIDGGSVDIGIESTVIDFTSEIPTILRPGTIGAKELSQYIKKINVENSITSKNIKIKSPGMKYTHYSPNTEMILIEGESDKVINKINFLLLEYYRKNISVGVLGSKKYKMAKAIFIIGKTPKDIAYNLFRGMRFLDEKKLDLIIVENINFKNSTGIAINNRLKKASNRHIKV